MGGKAGRAALVVTGACLTLVLIALAFVRPSFDDGQLHLAPRFALDRWLASLPEHGAWLAPFAALSAALPLARAVVWRHATPTEEHGGSVRDRYHALALGGLVHNVLPGRLGVPATAFFFGRKTGTPIGAALSSLLVSKLLELGALVAVAGLVAGIAPAGLRPGGLGDVVLAGAVVVVVCVAAAALAARYLPRLASRFERHRHLAKVAALLATLAAGLAEAGSLRHLARGLAAALLPVAALGFAYGGALLHVGAAGGVLGGFLLVAALTLAQFTPGLPIGAGVHYFVCAWAARTLGANDADAAALAFTSHLTTAIVNLAVGGASALRHRRLFSDLLAWRRRRAAAVTP